MAVPDAQHRAFTSARTAAILTNSYVGSSEVAVKGRRWLVVHMEFTKGSLTDCQIKLQYSDDRGTSWNDSLVRGAYTTGVYTPELDIALLDATITGGLLWDVSGYDVVRLAAVGTGTLTSSSLALSTLTSGT